MAKRHQRYIQAIEPFRKQFKCTAAQVHGIINRIVGENSSLASELKTKKLQMAQAELKIKELTESLELATKQSANLFEQVRELKAALADSEEVKSL